VQQESLISSNDVRGELRAAQYVRMSTDHQKYSTENQSEAIGVYAAQRNIKIVREYADEGRSGLSLDNRDALQKLIQDVESDRTDFDTVLVYDISRWGRFQDVDESAYYEFICKRAGIAVHYCAEEFENDGSLASTILKTVKRVAAADFNRQLSKKVFLGQCTITKLGFFKGGPPGYGLRRYLLEDGKTLKQQLAPSQRKSIQTDRVVLGPGPAAEVETVKRIFNCLVTQNKRVVAITAELNNELIPNACGNPWSTQNVHDILTNERYLGNNVFNRTSYKLQQKRVINPPEMWIRREGAFPGIIPPEVFAAAQEILAERRQLWSEQKLARRRKALPREREDLARALGDAAQTVPGTRRFSALGRAYRLAGHQPRVVARSIGKALEPEAILDPTAAAIISHVESSGGSALFNRKTGCLIVGDDLVVSLGVARPMPNGRDDLQWRVTFHGKARASDLSLVIRLNAEDAAIEAYYLLPTCELPSAKGRQLRLSNRPFFEACRYDGLSALCRVFSQARGVA
jgi:DNA invertase Pin-like site-specific DNA recombinase